MFDATRDERGEPYTRLTKWLPAIESGLHGLAKLDEDTGCWRRMLERLSVRYVEKVSDGRTALFAHNKDYARAVGVDITDKSLWEG